MLPTGWGERITHTCGWDCWERERGDTNEKKSRHKGFHHTLLRRVVHLDNGVWNLLLQEHILQLTQGGLQLVSKEQRERINSCKSRGGGSTFQKLVIYPASWEGGGKNPRKKGGGGGGRRHPLLWVGYPMQKYHPGGKRSKSPWEIIQYKTGGGGEKQGRGVICHLGQMDWSEEERKRCKK